MKRTVLRILPTLVLLLPAGDTFASDHKPVHAAPAAASHQAPHGAAPAAHQASHSAAPAASSHGAPPTAHAPAATAPSVAATAESAMQLLKEGNLRYVGNVPRHPNLDAARRAQAAANGQQPFVTVISCSDSRVPVEFVFDRGLGDLFVIRVAGNVCDTDEIATAEYGVEHLGTPLLVVLGHTKCGAVTAATSKAQAHGNLPRLLGKIAPAVAACERNHPELHGNALLPYAIQENVWQTIQDLLTTSEVLREQVKENRVQVEGAVYDIETGKVAWLGVHPRQQALLSGSPAPHQASPSNHEKSGHETAPKPAPKPVDAPAATGEHAAAPAGQHKPAPEPAAQHAAPVAVEIKAVRPAATEHVVEKAEVAKPASRPAAEHAVVVNEAPKAIEPPVPEAISVAAVPATCPAGTPIPPSLASAPLDRSVAEELYKEGSGYLIRGEYELAGKRLRSAIEIDPTLLAARNDLAGVLYLQGQYAEAAELYGSVLKTDPSYRNALRGAALARAALKQYRDAQSMLERLLALDADDVQTRLELGDVLFLLGDSRAARLHWTHAAQADARGASGAKARLRLRVYSRTGSVADAGL